MTWRSRRRECQPVVRRRRPGVHHRGLRHGADHDTGSGLPVLGTGAKEIGAEHDLGVYGFLLGYHVPVVLLGLLAGFQPICYQWIYWRSEEVWADEHSG